MSVSPGRMSLAPTGAEDDGDSGTKSVPAMLRLVKDCLARHTQCVTDAVSAVTEPGTLSTVMGTFEAGESPQDEQSQTARRVQLPSTTLLSDIAKEVDGGTLKAEAIRTDQHSLIRKAVEVSNQRRTDRRCSKPSTRYASTRINLATQISLEPKASRSSASHGSRTQRPANPGKGNKPWNNSRHK